MERVYTYDPKLKEAVARGIKTPQRNPFRPSQQRVLAFIGAEVAAGRHFPTAKQIAEHMGWQRERYQVFADLAATGAIRRRKDKLGRLRLWELVS